MSLKALDYLPRAELSSVIMLDSANIPELVAAAGLLLFEVRQLDLKNCPNKATLLTAMARLGQFPAYFGDNWDALADCLTEHHGEGAGILWVFENVDDFQQQNPEEFEIFHDILIDSAHFWAHEQFPFWVCFERNDELIATEDSAG